MLLPLSLWRTLQRKFWQLTSQHNSEQSTQNIQYEVGWPQKRRCTLMHHFWIIQSDVVIIMWCWTSSLPSVSSVFLFLCLRGRRERWQEKITRKVDCSAVWVIIIQLCFFDGGFQEWQTVLLYMLHNSAEYCIITKGVKFGKSIGVCPQPMDAADPRGKGTDLCFTVGYNQSCVFRVKLNCHDCP